MSTLVSSNTMFINCFACVTTWELSESEMQCSAVQCSSRGSGGVVWRGQANKGMFGSLQMKQAVPQQPCSKELGWEHAQGRVWLSHSQSLDGGTSRLVLVCVQASFVSLTCTGCMLSCIARAWLRRNGHFKHMNSAWLRRESCIAWDRPQPSTRQLNAPTAACTEPGHGYAGNQTRKHALRFYVRHQLETHCGRPI